MSSTPEWASRLPALKKSDSSSALAVTAAVVLGVPALAFTVARRILKLDVRNAAGVAALYGSVSSVTFVVARSFAGDKRQLVPLIKAGLAHKGLSFIDVISPCVTFNNNPESTKSYHWVREHSEATGTVDFVPFRQTIDADYDDESVATVVLHDESEIRLHKHSPEVDVTDRRQAIDSLEDHKAEGLILTGVLYVNPESTDTHEILNTSLRPLNSLTEADLCPGADILEAINAAHR